MSVEDNKAAALMHAEEINTGPLPNSQRLAEQGTEQRHFTSEVITDKINDAVKLIGAAGLKLHELMGHTTTDLQAVEGRLRAAETMEGEIATLRQNLHDLFAGSENEGATGARHSIDQVVESVKESKAGLMITSNHFKETQRIIDITIDSLTKVLRRAERTTEKLMTTGDTLAATSTKLEETGTSLEGTVTGLETYEATA